MNFNEEEYRNGEIIFSKGNETYTYPLNTLKLAFDLGILYKREIKDWEGAGWSVGIHASNLGPKIKYPVSYTHLNQAFCRILYIGVPSERDGDQREIYQVLILIK